MPASPSPSPVQRALRLLVVARVAGLGLLIGVTAAVLANGFVAGIVWLNETLLIAPRSRMMAAASPWLPVATVAVPIIGGLLVGAAHRLLAERRAHGPAEVIAAVQTRRGRLALKPALVSGVSGLVSLGSGASVGQYGPLVHLGGSLGSAWARLFRAGVTVDNIAIACGVAAAISTVFNAPIAGILFAHEVILRHFALRAFAPVALASIFAFVAARAVLPQPALFRIEPVAVAQVWEYALFPLLGVLCALLAAGYMATILGAGRLAARLPLPASLKPALAGAALGLTALWVPEVLGIGSETLRFAFIDGAFGHWELPLVLLLKLLATALCLGFGFAGGVFSPALVIGSLFGALVGSAVTALAPDASPLVVYAVCGMVAVTAPVIGAPLTTIVIVFEMTANYPLTLAALASVALANLVASQLFGRSFFDHQLSRRGLDLSAGRSRALLAARTVAPLTDRRVMTASPDQSVVEVRAAMARRGVSEAYCVDAEGRFQGTLLLPALVEAEPDRPAWDLRQADAIRVRGDTSIWDAMQLLSDFVGEGVAVVDASDRLVGRVVEAELIRAYLDILAEMRREEYATH